jgi:hypothetical protein
VHSDGCKSSASGNRSCVNELVHMDPVQREFRFYAFVSGCLFVAILMMALMINGKIGGHRVAQARSHAVVAGDLQRSRTELFGTFRTAIRAVLKPFNSPSPQDL